MTRRAGAAFVLMAMALTSACHVYRSQPIHGRVTDDQTQQPLEGAVVVAVWELHGGWFHPSVSGNLMALEAVTDQAGRFSLPAWGPEWTFSSYVKQTDPTLIVFHRDYYFWIRSNDGSLEPPPRLSSEMLASQWTGKTIGLMRRASDWGESEANARSAERYLLLDLAEPRCIWQRMPHLTLELLRRAEESRGNGIPSVLPAREMLYRSGRCADPDVQLRGVTNDNNKNKQNRSARDLGRIDIPGNG